MDFETETSTTFYWDYWELYDLNYTNVTNATYAIDEEPIPELWTQIFLGIVLSSLCLLTTVGNAMVLHAVRTERRLQTVSFWNQCTCDVIKVNTRNNQS